MTAPDAPASHTPAASPPVDAPVDVATVRAELRARLTTRPADNDDHDAPPGGWLPGERESLGRLAALVDEGEDCDG